jgi:hypothetical protein
MKSKYAKKLIVSLIVDDLIHAKLVEGLIALNLKAEDYYLNLSDTIINLMGFKGQLNETMFEYYLDLQKRARYVDNAYNNAEFKKLALQMYEELKRQRPGDRPIPK